jgi:hypothetical protein
LRQAAAETTSEESLLVRLLNEPLHIPDRTGHMATMNKVERFRFVIPVFFRVVDDELEVRWDSVKRLTATYQATVNVNHLPVGLDRTQVASDNLAHYLSFENNKSASSNIIPPLTDANPLIAEMSATALLERE